MTEITCLVASSIEVPQVKLQHWRGFSGLSGLEGAPVLVFAWPVSKSRVKWIAPARMVWVGVPRLAPAALASVIRPLTGRHLADRRYL